MSRSRKPESVLRSPLFRKLLFSAFLLIAVALVILDFYLTRYVAERETQSTEQRLSHEARILAGELWNVPPGELVDWAHRADRRAQARITIIDREGLVLADSQHDRETMENHANRPEIREALAGRTGASVRHSATLNRDLCYVALPVTGGSGQPVVLRLAVPLEELASAVAAVRSRIIAASLITAGIALLIAYIFSARITRRIRRLQSFAESLPESPGSATLSADGEDELGALARALARMGAQLRDLIEKLSVESARREAILSSMVEGVLAVDQEMRIVFCNESFARAIGGNFPVAERLPLLSLVRDAGLLELLTKALVSRETLSARLQLPVAKDRTFEVQTAPLTTASRRGSIAVLHDVTELERLDRVRKDFVANVSHELRTPLTAIQGYAETLLDGAMEDVDAQRKFLETIRAHAIRLNNISSDLLTLSELDAGVAPSPASSLSLADALQTALRTVESGARLADVKLVAGNLADVNVRGQKVRLEQALVNLLDNAIKFNRPGGEVRVEIGKTNEDEASVIIADTGIGIPSEDLPRIFERFYRVDKARSRAVGGTGLGLSIVKHVIELMGGRIAVESDLGKGSKFTVFLPAAEI